MAGIKYFLSGLSINTDMHRRSSLPMLNRDYGFAPALLLFVFI
jgi:hypothetical protein